LAVHLRTFERNIPGFLKDALPKIPNFPLFQTFFFVNVLNFGVFRFFKA
jgi:hypothetical protein